MYDMHDPHLYIYIYIYIFTTDPSPSFITQSSKSFFIVEKSKSPQKDCFFGSKTKPKDCVPLLLTPALLLLVFPGHETGDAKLMRIFAGEFRETGEEPKIGDDSKNRLTKKL
jgi:hypothetical protein